MPSHTFAWLRGQGSPLNRDWVTWQKRSRAWNWAAMCQSQGIKSKKASCTIKCATIVSFWWRNLEIDYLSFNLIWQRRWKWEQEETNDLFERMSKTIDFVILTKTLFKKMIKVLKNHYNRRNCDRKELNAQFNLNCSLNTIWRHMKLMSRFENTCEMRYCRCHKINIVEQLLKS